jgi:hypothetical protein
MSTSNSNPDGYTTPRSVAARIANLPNLSMAEIKAIWEQLFGKEVPTHNRRFLERRIAQRWQEIEFRKTDRHMMDRNRRRVDALINTGKLNKPDHDIRHLPGTTMTRTYNDQEHVVTVTADGNYRFEGRPYTSLSRIAREITGTRWSGPVFFGLKTNAARKSAKSGAHK